MSKQITNKSLSAGKREKRAMIKGVAALAFAAGALLALGSTSAEALTLRLATDSGAPGSPTAASMEQWAELIEEGSNGEITVHIFYQNELGSQQEVFDLHVAGDVDLMINWPITSYDRRIGVIYTPYMVFTWEEALEAYRTGGWINSMLDGIYNDVGLKFFGAWPEGFNGVATRGKYALTPEDAGDLKVRVPPMFPQAETLEAMGYQTASIDWSEVFTSIETGVVDGDAANVVYWDYEYFRDTLDYYVRTKQAFVTGMISMNLMSWESLTDEQQQLVLGAAVQVMEDHFINGREIDEHYARLADESGMTYIEPDEEVIRALAATVREKVWPQMEQEVGAEIMDVVRANAAPL